MCRCESFTLIAANILLLMTVCVGLPRLAEFAQPIDTMIFDKYSQVFRFRPLALIAFDKTNRKKK